MKLLKNSKFRNVKSNLISGQRLNLEKIDFSIIIPTFNRIELKESLKSIFEQRNTNYMFEVIIIDNNPLYSITNDIVSSFYDNRILYYKNEKNIGPTGNWNRGIELSNGEWLVFLHDDDLLDKRFLYNTIRTLNKHKNIQGIWANPIYFGSKRPNNFKLRVIELMKIYKSKAFNGFYRYISNFESDFFNENIFGVATCGIVLNKVVFEKNGGFNEEDMPLIDWFYFYKINSNCKILKPNYITGYYRWESNDSLRVETLNGIMRGHYKMLLQLKNKNILGAVLFKILNNVQLLRVFLVIKNQNQNIDISEFKELKICRNKNIRYVIFTLIFRLYKIFL